LRSNIKVFARNDLAAHLFALPTSDLVGVRLSAANLKSASMLA
jgi:hypothetical protein